MSETFQSIHFNVAGESDDSVEGVGARPLVLRAGPRTTPSNSFDNDEAAARFYLGNIFARDTRSGVRGLTAPQSPQVVPDLQLRDSQRSPLTNTSIVRFVQTKSSIPVFGSRAIVEMDDKRELLAIDAELADVKGVAPIANIAPKRALESIAIAANVSADSLGSVDAPKLTFYRDEDNNVWHLAYYFQGVPAAPEEFFAGMKSHGSHKSLASSRPELDYLVDAHDGSILLYWSSVPTLVRCEGYDEEGQLRKFYGDRTAQGTYALVDTMQRIKTIDLGGTSIDTPDLPTIPLACDATTFVNCEAAISAHFNASRVCDFLRSVLKRDGVDGKGMELISYVNCTSPSDEAPPEWHNAAWWKQRMWYGQSRDQAGKLRSFARYLDIIAHELAHGITEYTANLAYLRQSGALNESFSDIFGVIIRNWDRSQPDTGGDVATWNWEIGSGLGGGNLPLRDMKDPTRTGDPDHMNAYLNTPADNGGVHTNSNIHNKAAYNFLTMPDPTGHIMFTPQEVAVLYYLTLGRLDKLATFKQTRDTLLNVAGTYYSGDPHRQDKLDAISTAYAVVGI
jgi:bacillolysin/neutral peptidase B